MQAWFQMSFSQPGFAERARARAADPALTSPLRAQLAIYFCAPDPAFVPAQHGEALPVAMNTRSNKAKMMAANKENVGMNVDEETGPAAMTEDGSGAAPHDMLKEPRCLRVFGRVSVHHLLWFFMPAPRSLHTACMHAKAAKFSSGLFL